MSIQELKKNLDLKLKNLKSVKFGFTDSAPSFADVVDDNIEIDARGVAYKKEDQKKIPAVKKDKLLNKEGKVKDDNANAHTGEDSTGFGYVGAFDQHMSACRQSGGSLEHCLEGWLLKNSGVGLTPEKVKLIEEYMKSKKVDTLQYEDYDYEKLKSDFGLDLKPIIEKLEKVDGICANNKKLVAENKKIKDDLVNMKNIFDNLNASWLKKAENRKLELIELLSKEHKVSDDFLKEKNLDELENYLKLLEIAKKNQKDDGVVEDFDPFSKENLSDGIQMPFGKPISHKEYLNEQTKTLRKSKFGWVK